jgi:hypothetical protein
MQFTAYALSSINNFGVSGNVWIGDFAFGTLVVISLKGTQVGNMYPAHIQSGTCGSEGGGVTPLEAVDGVTGLSVTVTDLPYNTILSGNHYLNIHASSEDVGTIIACTEIVPKGNIDQANSDSTGTNATEQPVTEVRTEEFETLTTASYGIFEVSGSGIKGQVQFTEKAEGGTQIVVTLRGVRSGANFPMDIKTGDCGPDGLALLELNNFPLGLIDPDASMTETEMPISTFSERNNYLTVYSKDGTVLACGEVGLGANK